MKSSRISLGILGILNSKLQDSFSTNITNFCDFNSHFVNGNIFFFQNQLYFWRVCLKKYKNVSYLSFT